MTASSALVLFSGGQDSTVCLAWALERYQRVETIGFDYRQRHRVELSQRPIVRQSLAALNPNRAGRLGEDQLIDASALTDLGATAMTHEVAIEMGEAGLPTTFVPGRNLYFLTLAGALAYRRGIDVLVGGMCETDFSGYPDCRRATLDAQETTLSLGLDRPLKIETPLMHVDKAGTWALADAIGGSSLVDLILEHTHTCYRGDRSTRHDWGYGCDDCPACDLRKRGWMMWRSNAGGREL
ncbi:MAG: 7-cyano-7-deazaguanine synthase QueC [Pseudomonadota bacterium]